MRTLVALIILLSISFNANSETSNEMTAAASDKDARVWNTDEIFCSEFRGEVDIVMKQYNDTKAANRDINEEIKRKSEPTDEFSGEDFFKTKEYKKLIKKFEENNDYIYGTIIPMLETRANIMKGLCKD